MVPNYSQIKTSPRFALVSVELNDKRQLTLPPTDPMLAMLDLGYALNVHMAQGMTASDTIQTISGEQRNLATGRPETGLATRAENDQLAFTDNLDRLLASTPTVAAGARLIKAIK